MRVGFYPPAFTSWGVAKLAAGGWQLSECRKLGETKGDKVREGSCLYAGLREEEAQRREQKSGIKNGTKKAQKMAQKSSKTVAKEDEMNAAQTR